MSENLLDLHNIKKQDIIDDIIDCVLNKRPILFAKYGDGEYNNANRHRGHNCDGDFYTENFANALKESFIYITSNGFNSYIGLWDDIEKIFFWESLVANNISINRADYHTFIIIPDFKSLTFQRKLKMYQTIQQSSLKKYIICNQLLIKSKILFNATSLIHVPFQNWFDNYFDELIELVCREIGDDPQPIVMTSCGMGAKVVIAKLHKIYPGGLFFDIGSAIDFLCTKRDSRGWGYNYEELYNAFSSILPSDWHDPKYESLYIEAQQKLGLHL
jgi:hypothetical protein